MKVLVTGAFTEYEKLKNEFNDLEFEFIQNEQEKTNIDVSCFEYVICNNLFLYNDIENFKSLKYIQVTSAGLDRLPMDYINEHNIKVFNARGVYSIPMAEWTICKILDVYKKSFKFYENQKKKIWEKDKNIIELNGKTATIVGYGSVGQEIAKRLHAFGVKINVVNRSKVTDEKVSHCFSISQLNDGLKNANIIIITIALAKETESLFNKYIYKEINNNPILINVSRGKIINTSDLIKSKDKFLAIILDVFDDEPLTTNNKLWGMDNIIISPHVSYASTNNSIKMYSVVKDNLGDAVNEK